MSDFWPRLGWHVHRGEVDATVRLLHNATEEQRRSAAADLEAYVKKTPPEQWWSRQHRLQAVVVAAVGCLPSAARVATLLGRTVIADSMVSVPVKPVVQVARLRGTPFMADLGHRLAAQREAAALAAYEVAAALVVEAGSAPPDTDAFVRGWVRHHLFAQEMLDPRNVVLDRMRDDPMLTALLPRLFEIDGIGTDLTRESWRKQGTVVTALATLAKEGRLDRTMLLDGCVGRLLRGDRPNALRAFGLLVDQLAPTVDEAAARTLDLVRLLPDAPSTVAGLAQRLLRQVDDAGRLELDTLLKVSEQVLARTEKGLVKTQLRWLGAVAKREPDRAGEIAGVVSVACGHPAADIQELARKLGGEAPAVPEPWVGDAPVAAPVAAMPPPISSAGELAEEAAALFSAPLSVVSFERVLAGLVAVRATDPDGVTELLTPMLDRLNPRSEFDHLPSPADLNDALWSAIRTAAGATGKSSWQRLVAIVRDTIRGVARHDSVVPVPAPQRALVLRAGEVCARLTKQPVPNLVATPTSVNGHVDAGTLVDRLAAAERDGWEPWRFDLEQALLRLPREVDADVLARARKLGSAAGTRLADWLAAGGLPDPVPTRIAQRSAAVWMPEWRAVVALAPGGPGSGLLADELCTHVPPKGTGVWMPLTEALWPAVLPGHRDVIAAWALPTIAAAADQDQPGSRELLPLLAECTGPVGPALTIALAYGLAAKETTDRVAAVDAVLALAGSVDPVLLGQEMGAMAAGGVVKLNRGTGALTDAARGGAPDLVRAVVCAALPAVLAATPPPRGTPDLLALAAETVTATGWRGSLPEVTELAGRPGKSRSHVEARRLTRLAGPE